MATLKIKFPVIIEISDGFHFAENLSEISGVKVKFQQIEPTDDDDYRCLFLFYVGKKPDKKTIRKMADEKE